MMKDIKLGPNQCCYIEDELIFKAVCAAYEVAGVRVYRLHNASNSGLHCYGTGSYGGFTSVSPDISDYKKLSTEQILFADAPDWATLVVQQSNEHFFYLEHNKIGESLRLQRFGGAPSASDTEHAWDKAKVIAIRQEHQKWMPKVGYEALVQNDGGYTLAYGIECIGKTGIIKHIYTSQSGIDVAVVEIDSGGYCFRVEMLSEPKTEKETWVHDAYGVVSLEVQHDYPIKWALEVIFDAIKSGRLKAPSME